jgi:hypothetical protein
MDRHRVKGYASDKVEYVIVETTRSIKQPDPHAANADPVVLAFISLRAKNLQIITPMRAAINSCNERVTPADFLEGRRVI